MRSERGFTLTELLLALILASVLGMIVTKTLVTTARFYAQDHGQRNARTVARSATGLIESELRMIDPTAGIVSADSNTITMRIPYAVGILCNTGGGANVTASLLPMDSLAYAQAGFSGFAVRDSLLMTTNYEASPTLATGSQSTCTTASITTLTGGKVVRLSPAPAAGFSAGSPVTLYQRVTYRFAASTALPGRRALWRDVVGTGLSEELVAPFDATARFRFYVLNADTSQALPPSPLTNLRGVELVLNGASERTTMGNAGPETATYTSAVFFRNRVN